MGEKMYTQDHSRSAEVCYKAAYLSPRFIVAAALIVKRHECVGGGAEMRDMLVETRGDGIPLTKIIRGL